MLILLQRVKWTHQVHKLFEVCLSSLLSYLAEGHARAVPDLRGLLTFSFQCGMFSSAAACTYGTKFHIKNVSGQS